MQIGNMRLARIERDDHPLTLEIDFYIFRREFSSEPVATCAHTRRILRLRSRSRSVPGFRDRRVPEKMDRPDRDHWVVQGPSRLVSLYLTCETGPAVVSAR